MAVNWKILAKFVSIPPEAWDAIIPHGPAVGHVVNSRLDAVALNPQPLPPHESVVGAQLLENVLISAIIVVGGKGAAREPPCCAPRSTTGAARAGRSKWPKPKPPKGWDEGLVFAGAALAAANLAGQYDHAPDLQEALGAAAEQLAEAAGGADTARRTGAKTPSSGSATRPTIERWSRAPSLRCCASTATSCAPPPPTGRRRRTGTRSGRSARRPRARLLAELQRLLLAGTRLGRDDVHALARLVVLAERRTPAHPARRAARPTCATSWPAPSCDSPIGRMLRVGLDVWDGSRTPRPVPSRPSSPDHHQRWFEQRATPGTAGELSVFLHPYRRSETTDRSAARHGIRWAVTTTTDIAADRARLLEIVRAKAIVHGRVTLSSGKEADYYVDLRRITLDGEASPLVGRVMRDLVADLDFDAVGGLTLGADPVATVDAARRGRGRRPARRVRRAQGRQGARPAAAHRGPVDRGPSGARRRGHLDHRGVTARCRRAPPQEAGATVVAVATIADRATGAAEKFADAGLRVPARLRARRTSVSPEPHPRIGV